MSFPYLNRPYCTLKADQEQAGWLKSNIKRASRLEVLALLVAVALGEWSLTAEADDVCLWQPTLRHTGVRSGTGVGDRSSDHDLGGSLQIIE